MKFLIHSLTNNGWVTYPRNRNFRHLFCGFSPNIEDARAFDTFGKALRWANKREMKGLAIIEVAEYTIIY